MNRKTIEKIIAEIKSESFRKDYVLGILETLLESLPGESISGLPPNFYVSNGPTAIPKVVTKTMNLNSINDIDESALIENSAMAVLNRIDKQAIQTE